MDQFNRILLIRTIRKAIRGYLENGTKLVAGDNFNFPEELLQSGGGLYVTLWRVQGLDVRASKGVISSDKPLIQTAIDAGIGAIRHDAIFPFVKDVRELDNLVVQVSIPAAPVCVFDIRNIDLSSKVLIISYGRHTGVFLPQVIEFAKWDPVEAVTQLCLKSGLPGNMWRNENVKIFTSEVESFMEVEPDSWNVANTYGELCV